MKEMVEKMGEIGEMGERKSIGNFYMRVGIFVSMYLSYPKRKKKERKKFNK